MGIEFTIDPNVIQALIVALAVILVDALLGIIRAIARGEFDFTRLPQFLISNLLPYVGSLLVLAVFSLFVQEIKAILLASAAFILAKFLAEIKNKLADMGAGSPDKPPETID
jgi:hypothetical protein